MPFDAVDKAISESLANSAELEKLPELAVQLGLTQPEYQKIIDILDRQPTVCEVYIFSLMWSEHCSYKHSKSLLRTLPTDGPAVLQGPGENAGVVDIGDGDAIAFKIESHNHPSAIEPFEGAATGVGGIIRDIFTMGARPIAVLDSLAFGSLEQARQRYLFEGSVAGIGHYGNCLGVPTVGGEVTFESAYEGNCLINAMAVGLLKHDRLTRAIGTGPGNPVLLIGSSTGRDGIGGASVLASQGFDEAAQNKRPAVQVGDPFMEKLLIEACLELLEHDLLLALGDLGAAGLTSSASEMASRGGVGIKMDVSKVHRREQGMTAYEVMVSESQERMLAVAKAEQVERVIEVCAKWDIPVSVIGEITDTGRFEVIDSSQSSDLPEAYIPADVLASSAPELHSTVGVPEYIIELRASYTCRQAVSAKLSSISLSDVADDIYQLLANPNIADKSWIYWQYDHQVQINTAVLPGNDAAVVRIGNTGRGRVTTNKAIALTTDSCGRKSYIDPYAGVQYAIAESLANISCVGAKPLGITNCLNFGDPDDMSVYWQFSETIGGMKDACNALNIPVTGGNVSFYNESLGSAIYPTPVIGMVGLIGNLRSCNQIGPLLKNVGDEIWLIGGLPSCLGGSEYVWQLCGATGDRLPKLDMTEVEANCVAVRQALDSCLLTAVHDISKGGLAVTLAEMTLGGKGASISLPNDKVSSLSSLMQALFGEEAGSFVISVAPDKHAALESVLSGIRAQVIGTVTDKALAIEFDGDRVQLDLARMRQIYTSSLPELVS